VSGFNFTAAKISAGGDLGGQQVGKSAAQLAAACIGDLACKGFTSSGWLKSSIKVPALWTDWNGSATMLSPCDGMFVRPDASFESKPPAPSPCPVGSRGLRACMRAYRCACVHVRWVAGYRCVSQTTVPLTVSLDPYLTEFRHTCIHQCPYALHPFPSACSSHLPRGGLQHLLSELC